MTNQIEYMKAFVYRRNGPPDVLTCEEIAKPTPADDEVLIRVHAASVNPADYRLMRGLPILLRMAFALMRPKVKQIGADVAGVVEAVGKSVSQFRPGDAVFGVSRGAFAEYACAHESKLVSKSANVSFEQAASVPIAGLTALQGLRDQGKLQPGQNVLINGAAGGVGTFAVQTAKWLGANVTGVCSTNNLELVRSLGADHVIDYTREDFTTARNKYDLILDCVGNHSAWACGRALKPRGICAIAGAPKQFAAILLRLFQAFSSSCFTRQKSAFFIAKMSQEDLKLIDDLIGKRKLTPVIDRRYSLSEVPDAVRYLEQGHARGKVIIEIANVSADRSAPVLTNAAKHSGK